PAWALSSSDPRCSPQGRRQGARPAGPATVVHGVVRKFYGAERDALLGPSWFRLRLVWLAWRHGFRQLRIHLLTIDDRIGRVDDDLVIGIEAGENLHLGAKVPAEGD